MIKKLKLSDKNVIAGKFTEVALGQMWFAINEVIDHINQLESLAYPVATPSPSDEIEKELTEEELSIIKWWREGKLTLHYNSDYKGAIVAPVLKPKQAKEAMEDSAKRVLGFEGYVNHKSTKQVKECPICHGSGIILGAPRQGCPICNGTGRIK